MKEISFQTRLFKGITRFPDKEAVIYGEEVYTYSELDKRVNQVTSAILEKGFPIGSFIGLYLQDTFDIVVSIIAVLKAGCVFVPLDTAYPAKRIFRMIQLVELNQVITDQQSYQELEEKEGSILEQENLLFIEDTLTQSSELSLKEAEEIQYSLEDKIYVYFTSGSSGTPKAIVGKNKSLLHFINWEIETFQITSHTRVSQLTTVGFDAFLRDVFVPLLAGGCVCVPGKDFTFSALELVKWLDQYQVNLVHCVPSIFRIFNTSELTHNLLQSLQYILLSGEKIYPQELKNWYQVFDERIQLVNLYGPTETTMIKTCYFIRKQDTQNERISVGQPMKGARIIILNKNQKVCRQGVTGEIYIRTPFMTFGYHNNDALNNEVFIPNPFTQDERDLFFRTGDLGRILPDGNIDMIGRKDRQIKIRGIRIELDEIEKTLLNHELVGKAAVVDRETDTHEKSLCAYVVPQIPELGNRKGRKGDRQEEGPEELNQEKELTDTEGTLIRAFQTEKEKSRNRIAIRTNAEQMTYDFLEHYSLQIAQEIEERYDDRYKLDSGERSRYQRQIMLDEWGMEAQEKIKSTTVFVGGAGGSASALITQLALIGFGTLIVCDYDKVELSNLNRQFLHDDSRIGLNKAESAKITIKRLNPNVNVVVHTEQLTQENVYDMVGDASIIFDNIDEMKAKFILSECAATKHIPHIISSMIDMNSYAAIFYPPETPCFHCLYDKAFVENIEKTRGETHVKKNPLPVVASSLFVCTGFVVNEALKFILGHQEIAFNKYFLFNQKGSPRFAESDGFKLIGATFSEHFKEISREQGFDWDQGWRGNFLEELHIKKDPHCPMCSNEHRNKNSRAEPPRNHKKENISQHLKRETVALLLDDEIEWIAALLGTLKAHKTIVPLDVFLDGQDLMTLLEGSEARVIVTLSKYGKLALKIRDQVNKNIQIMHIDEIEKECTSSFTENPSWADADPVQEALLLYEKQDPAQEQLSEKTDEPMEWKWIPYTQRKILEHIFFYKDRMKLGSQDTLPIFYPFFYRISQFNLWGALLNGTTIYPCFIRKSENREYLKERIIKGEITVFPAEAPLLRYFLEKVEPNHQVQSLRLLINQSGALYTRDLKDINQKCSALCNIIDQQGTEENLFQYQEKKNQRTKPLNKIKEIEEYILQYPGIQQAAVIPIWYQDEDLLPGRKSPTLCAYISSQDQIDKAQLRAYLKDNLPNHGLHLPLCLINIDEAEMISYPGIDRLLQAKERDLNREIITELRTCLEQELVGSMVPGYFMLIREIPLLTNGKVDRHALPEPEIKRETNYLAPQTDLGKKLVEIWADILEIKKEVISLNSNFFELGGHSLRATILASRIHQIMDVKIPLVEIFKKQTIAEQIKYIGSSGKEQYAEIRPTEHKEYYPLSSGQKRMYFMQQMDLESTTFNSQVRVVIEGKIEKQRLDKAFAQIIQRHEGFRTYFSLLNDEPVQRISANAEFAVEYDDLDKEVAGTDGEKAVLEQMVLDFLRPFDLTRPPLMRVGLIRMIEEQYLLMVDMHHVITDAIARSLIIKDLMTLYEERELTGLRLQYKDYVVWMDQEDQKRSLKKQEEYWMGQYANGTPKLQLPTDTLGTDEDDIGGNTVELWMESEETEGLKRLAKSIGATLFMMLTAVYNVLLSKLGGQEDIVIGNVVIGRRHMDLEKIIGVFINPVTMRNYPEGDKTFIQFSKEVKNRALEAFDNQDYPFEDLVKRVVKTRETGSNGIYDTELTLFTTEMQEMITTTAELTDLSLKEYPFDIIYPGKQKMSLEIYELDRGLLLMINYWKRLFRENTVMKFLEALKQISATVIQNPEILLKDIDFISEDEKNRTMEKIQQARESVQADFDI